MTGYITLIVSFIAFFVCLSVHEAAHAWAANRFGDPTSKIEGRLSLNPLRHIDWFGTILLPLFLILSHLPAFGYAKPVMIDRRNFQNPSKDYLLSSLAGPGANLLFAAVVGILISAFPFLSFLTILVEINIILAMFNLIPIPPLDGSKIWQFFLNEETYFNLERYGPLILIAVILLFGSIFDFLFNIDITLTFYLTHLF